MKGLELSRLYYSEIFLPECRKRFPSAEGHFAAGLVGEGSECFGYDDDLSQDHTFGLRLCIWLTQEDYARCGPDLEALWLSLPGPFKGYQRTATEGRGGKRSRIFQVRGFYRRLLGVPDAPDSTARWLEVPEPNLAAATNGEVYADEPGGFTAVRSRLLAHFPPDVTRYYLAQHVAIAAQTGQYNLLRAHRHGESLAADNIKARFIFSAIAVAFLLNRTYRPFYKWAPRALRTLPILGGLVYERLVQLSGTQDIRRQITLVEEVCAALLAEMRRQGYTSGQSDFLMDHLPALMDGIQSQQLRQREISLVF